MTQYIPKFGDVLKLKTGEQPVMVLSYYPRSNTVDYTYLSSYGSIHRAEIFKLVDFVGCKSRIKNYVLEGIQRDYTYKIVNMTTLMFNPISKSKQNKNSEKPKEKGIEQMSTLYEVPGKTKSAKPRFATKLAVNSEGKMVMEIKNTTDIEVFDESQIKEVTPYTVTVRCSSTGTTYSRITKEGSVVLNDIIVNNGFLYIVAEINTKNKNAKTELKGSKLKTTPI